jgi:hypothetical protein
MTHGVAVDLLADLVDEELKGLSDAFVAVG